jgi:hypothetical protein
MLLAFQSVQVGKFMHTYSTDFEKGGGGGDKVGIGAPSGPVQIVHQKSCADGTFEGPAAHQRPH